VPRKFELPLAIAGVIVLLFAAGWIAVSLFSRKPSADPAAQPPVQVQAVTVPNFVGTDSTDVAKTADLIGLTVQMSDGRSEAPFLEGVVTSQSPAAGSSLPRSSRVELRVATRTVPVPTLVGTTLNSALTALEDSGMRLGKTETQPVGDARPGTIVRQRPEAGAVAAAGSVVDVVVAATPVPKVRPSPLRSETLATVPDLRGLKETDARLAIRRAGLRLGQVSTRPGSAAAGGTIVGQSPPSGAQIRLGSEVDLLLSVPQR
jgi:serine/threonine-protein kinase